MKTKKRYMLTVGIFIFLLVTILLAPKAVGYVEDYSLMSKTESYEIEKVDLTPDQSYFMSKLMNHANVLLTQKTYVEHGEKLSNDDVFQVEKELIHAFSIENDVKVKDHNENVILAPSFDMQDIYLIWECWLLDDNGNEYYFWIDDSSSKMLACIFPVWQIENYEIYNLIEKVGDYYGFQRNDSLDMKELKRESEKTVIYSDDTDQEMAMLPIVLRDDYVYFNVYPESVSIGTGVIYKK